MHDLRVKYEKILELTQFHFEHLTVEGNFQFYPKKPKMTDLELIALCLCTEASSIDSENLLFSKLKQDYPGWYSQVGCRTRFNRRRRRLANRIWEVAKVLSRPLQTRSKALIVDSMPCPIVKLAREKRFRICQESWSTRPAKGYSAIEKKYFIGYKLHLMIADNGSIADMQVTPANVHDIQFLKRWENQTRYRNKDLLGDRGYISKEMQLSLFDQYKIELKVPGRANQKLQVDWDHNKRSKRKRIETLFSQLCDQFRIKINFAKSFAGFYARIVSKLAAISVLQQINFQNKRPLNHLKHAWLC